MNKLILYGFFGILLTSCVIRNKNQTLSEKQLDKEILEVMWNEVWFGFNSDNEIVSIIQDNFLEASPNEEVILKILQDYRKIKLGTQESWKMDTDFNKLSRAFTDLNKSGIISLHFAGYTISDCITEAIDIHDNYGLDTSKINGFCAYHEQDLERLIPPLGVDSIPNGTLLLLFGDIQGDSITGVKIGQKIVQVLKTNGLETTWDENINSRIMIENFRWEKRFTGESWLNEMDKVIKILKKI